MQPAQQPEPPPGETGPRPATAPSTRALLATLRVTLLAAGAPEDDLRDFDAWAVWVIRLLSEPQRPLDVSPLPDYAAARELVAEVSARVVRSRAGLPVARREALFCIVAGHERMAVAYLDQHMLQRGRPRR